MTDENFKIVNRIYNDILSLCGKVKDCKKCELANKDVYGNNITCLGYEINLIYHRACKENPGRLKLLDRITGI